MPQSSELNLIKDRDMMSINVMSYYIDTIEKTNSVIRLIISSN